MKRISAEEALKMVDELAESSEVKKVLIVTDSLATFDIIKEHAKQKSDPDTGSIKNCDSPIVSLQPHPQNHLILWHRFGDFYIDELPDLLSNYDKKTSLAIMAYGGGQTEQVKAATKLLNDFDTYFCFNPYVLTVGQVLNYLTNVNDKEHSFVVVKKNNMDYSELCVTSADSLSIGLQVYSGSKYTFTVAAFIKLLSAFDENAVIDINGIPILYASDICCDDAIEDGKTHFIRIYSSSAVKPKKN